MPTMAFAAGVPEIVGAVGVPTDSGGGRSLDPVCQG